MVEWRKWRSRVRVSVFEEGTERPGSEVEAETTVVAPGPETAIMEALAWTRKNYVPVSPAAQAFVVWKGHRDMEAAVAVCETRELADQFVAGNGVEMRPNYYGRDELVGADEDATPWGIDEVPFVRGVADLFEVLGS